jgi:hypothetical protein
MCSIWNIYLFYLEQVLVPFGTSFVLNGTSSRRNKFRNSKFPSPSVAVAVEVSRLQKVYYHLPYLNLGAVQTFGEVFVTGETLLSGIYESCDLRQKKPLQDREAF